MNESCGGKISLKTARENGKKYYALKLGIHSLTKEERSEKNKNGGKVGGKKSYEIGVGIHSQTKEELIELGKKSCSQKWMCIETGFITNPGNLTKYQKARGIDTSKRIKLTL